MIQVHTTPLRMFNSLFLRLVVPVLVLWTVVVLSSPVPTGGGVAATTQHIPMPVQIIITGKGSPDEHWRCRTGPLVLHASIDRETWDKYPTFEEREKQKLVLQIGQNSPKVKFSPPPEIIELGELKDGVSEEKILEEGKVILGWKRMPYIVTTPGGTCMDFIRMELELFLEEKYIDERVFEAFMKYYKKEYTGAASVAIGKGPVLWSPPDVVTIPGSSTSG
ncbi:hypothetical protein EV360DRAFT_84361 [Lentinula raphanica]|nr:hypothetical protein EV360DRAFT_84361 [Lentinula raphanica]